MGDNLDLCDDQAKKQIAKFQKWDIDELELQIEEYDAKLEKIKNEAEKKVKGYESEMENFREKISATNKKKDDKIAKATKEMGLKFMKAVSAAKKRREEGRAIGPKHGIQVQARETSAVALNLCVLSG